LELLRFRSEVIFVRGACAIALANCKRLEPSAIKSTLLDAAALLHSLALKRAA
jgi:hypothetical protein